METTRVRPWHEGLFLSVVGYILAVSQGDSESVTLKIEAYVPPKRQLLQEAHGVVIFQKIESLIITAVRT
jgi:hypothetical protein